MPCHSGFGAAEIHNALRALGLCRSHSLGEPEIKLILKIDKQTMTSYKIHLYFHHYFQKYPMTPHFLIYPGTSA